MLPLTNAEMKCNINPETGIRFGVAAINKNVDLDWFTSIAWEETGEYRSPKLSFDWGEEYLVVLYSEYTVRCRLCSPCFPNAGNLDQPDEDYGYLTYTLPPEAWVENPE